MHVRIAGAVVGLLAMAGSASADVKMVTQMSGRMMGRSVSGETITYVKGNRMRTDQVMGGAQLSTIMNVDSGELISINHKNKEAEIWNVVQLSKTMNAAGITADGVDVSITPNSQSKEIAGYKATGYDMRVAVTSAMGGVQGMTMTVTITGPSFLSSAAPGAQDYAAFYAAAAERGFFFGDPRAAKAQPGKLDPSAAWFGAVNKWMLWPGVAMMVASSPRTRRFWWSMACSRAHWRGKSTARAARLGSDMAPA